MLDAGLYARVFDTTGRTFHMAFVMVRPDPSRREFIAKNAKFVRNL